MSTGEWGSRVAECEERRGKETTVEGGDIVTISAPDKGGWVAAVIRDRRQTMSDQLGPTQRLKMETILEIPLGTKLGQLRARSVRPGKDKPKAILLIYTTFSLM